MQEAAFEKYLEKINFQGETKVNLSTLSQLIEKHSQHIPFENFTPFFQLGIDLSPDALFDKLVIRQRGGYCFEHGYLLKAVLEYIGFEITPLLGRAGRSPEESGRTHMILLVHLEGEDYIADVGYGGLGPIIPIAMTLEKEQASYIHTYRLMRLGMEYRLEIKLEGEWKRLYDFSLLPQNDMDFKVGNWYTETHPDSTFTNLLVLGMVDKDRRYTMANRKFSTYFHDESKNEIVYLEKDDDFVNTIQEVFKIDTASIGLEEDWMKHFK